MNKQQLLPGASLTEPSRSVCAAQPPASFSQEGNLINFKILEQRDVVVANKQAEMSALTFVNSYSLPQLSRESVPQCSSLLLV